MTKAGKLRAALRDAGTERTLPIKRNKKKAGKRKKSIREIAENLKAPPLRELINQNLCAACALLRETVADEIENIAENPRLVAALENAERAEQIVRAGR